MKNGSNLKRAVAKTGYDKATKEYIVSSEFLSEYNDIDFTNNIKMIGTGREDVEEFKMSLFNNAPLYTATMYMIYAVAALKVADFEMICVFLENISIIQSKDYVSVPDIRGGGEEKKFRHILSVLGNNGIVQKVCIYKRKGGDVKNIYFANRETYTLIQQCFELEYALKPITNYHMVRNIGEVMIKMRSSSVANKLFEKVVNMNVGYNFNVKSAIFKGGREMATHYGAFEFIYSNMNGKISQVLVVSGEKNASVGIGELSLDKKSEKPLATAYDYIFEKRREGDVKVYITYNSEETIKAYMEAIRNLSLKFDYTLLESVYFLSEEDMEKGYAISPTWYSEDIVIMRLKKLTDCFAT